RRTTLARADADGGPLGKALHDALAAASDFMVERAMKELIDGRDRLRRWVAEHDSLDAALLQLRQTFSLDGHEDLEQLYRSIVGGSRRRDDLAALVAALSESGTNGRAAAERLAPILTAAGERAATRAYLAFWTKVDGDLRATSTLCTNAV